MTLVGIGLSAVILFAAVPPIITQAYRGESLPMLNAMIRGQAVHPVEHYLRVWRDLSLRILTVEVALGLVLALLSWSPLQRVADRVLGAPVVSPRDGARSRMTRGQLIVANCTRYPWMCQLLAGSALALELAAPLLILLTVRWRTLLAAAMVAMMLGFGQMLGVFFRDFIALLEIFFFPWRQAGAWLAAGSGSPRLAVLYDSSCGLCNRTVAVVRALDLLGRVDVLDALADWPRVSVRWPALDQRAWLEDMHVTTDRGRVHVGFYGYRALAWHLPLGWLFLPLLYTPGVPAIGQRVYSLVARRRHGTGCALPM